MVFLFFFFLPLVFLVSSPLSLTPLSFLHTGSHKNSKKGKELRRSRPICFEERALARAKSSEITSISNPSDNKATDDRGRDCSAARNGDAKRRPPGRQIQPLADPIDERIRQRRAESSGPDPGGLGHLRPCPRERKDLARGLRARCETSSLRNLHDVEPRRGEGEGVPEGVEDAVGEHAGEAVPPEPVDRGRGAQAGFESGGGRWRRRR